MLKIKQTILSILRSKVVELGFRIGRLTIITLTLALHLVAIVSS